MIGLWMDEDIKKIALKNALSHDGKASAGSVFSAAVGADKSLLKDPKSLREKIEKIVSDINSKSLQEQKDEAAALGIELSAKKEEKTGLKDLPNVSGQVVLRLPPEPSGFMHLGHAISFMINYLYKEKYGGKLWLRFEDTNPNLVKEEFVKNFEEGIKWLGIKYDEKKFISSDMDEIYKYGERAIKGGKAYICSCDPDVIKDNRMKGKECQHRQQGPEQNLVLWNDAISGKIEQGKAVVRFKGRMDDRDMSMRDPSIFRIIKTDYKPYSLWPIYDFASVVEDHICGVTHILRSNEFKVSFQDRLRKELGLNKPTIVQYSRFNFEGTLFSKRKIRELIKKGAIPDWNDLRLPTLSAIRRRGIQPEAIREFVMSVGYSQSKHEYSWDLLFTLNRRIIDGKAVRRFFVEDPVKLSVEGSPNEPVELKNHPSIDLGTRKIDVNGEFFISKKDVDGLKAGEVVRLKDLYSIKILSIDKDNLKGKYLAEKTGEKIIQWVTERNYPIKIIKIGNLVDSEGNFNEESLSESNGLAEEDVRSMKEGDIVQFERFGFCRMDGKDKFIFISR